ncbi:leucyl/phenylalanyl-tRNA--protein transferase [Methylomagnum ishizawai]|uniref:Leucyl/phenylalanyl-tRNA--protein transferase n=1 Tax=Methylomagnum ishizawai TaxID=1760988 RepID=A0A1Y6CZ30_9GAMM|nr:leucyl/phenylalanyl-tRNA--protein transferase [Methylomagnum ishizawai]SMF95480.1 leucyl/phenylalanyl-tRNA--protein transferase [Methylomagnum ishizawai]
MLTVLNPFDKHQPFPTVDKALRDPNGLLAMGGCLSPERLCNAYRRGIFPWFGENEPILWWSPDPRLVLRPEQVKVSRSLGKRLKRGEFAFTHDVCFADVVEACAGPRSMAAGTWITADMKRAYRRLYEQGLAHSFEAWREGRLVGGLYGVALGRVFFGESMFHRATDASKAAFAYACGRLAEWGYALIDCQVHTQHLASLGAGEIPRREFVRLLNLYCEQTAASGAWQPREESL